MAVAAATAAGGIIGDYIGKTFLGAEPGAVRFRAVGSALFGLFTVRMVIGMLPGNETARPHRDDGSSREPSLTRRQQAQRLLADANARPLDKGAMRSCLLQLVRLNSRHGEISDPVQLAEDVAQLGKGALHLRNTPESARVACANDLLVLTGCIRGLCELELISLDQCLDALRSLEEHIQSRADPDTGVIKAALSQDLRAAMKDVAQGRAGASAQGRAREQPAS